MQITPDTKILDLLDKYPFLGQALARFNPKYRLLKNRFMLKTVGRVATVKRAASMGEVGLDELIRFLSKTIEEHSGGRAERKETLKEVIRSLHDGTDVQTAKGRFAEAISQVSPDEIAAVEQELIQEGLPAEEIQRLCDLHVGVFREVLDGEEKIVVEPGHPVDTFLRENEEILKRANRLGKLAAALGSAAPGPGPAPSGPEPGSDLKDAWLGLSEALRDFGGLEAHYLRKENQLFPFLEKHGFTGPSQVMWSIHDEIRAGLKASREAADLRDSAKVADLVPELARAVVEMVYKEEKILFPTSLEMLGREEWVKIRAGEHEIGYAFVSAVPAWPGGGAAEGGGSVAGSGAADGGGSVAGNGAASGGGASGSLIRLNTGALSLEQLDLMLTHLPVEVSFVNENDEVRYYSGHRDRIFPRSPAVIGRKVQNCHPPKSLHMVTRILDEFKAGRKDTAAFWIQLSGRFLYIRYFAVRNEAGQYKGTLEVTQDVTEIRKLDGQRRLLDWD